MISSLQTQSSSAPRPTWGVCPDRSKSSWIRRQNQYSTGAWKDKIAAGFTNSASRSGDKLSTLIQFAILAAQHGMHWVSLGLPTGNNSTHGSEQDLNRLGFWLGAAAQSDADQGPALAPPESDLLTAEYLGERVAKVTQQFVCGGLPAVTGLLSENSSAAHNDRVARRVVELAARPPVATTSAKRASERKALAVQRRLKEQR